MFCQENVGKRVYSRVTSGLHQTRKRENILLKKPMPAEAMNWRLKPQLNETVCQMLSCILNAILSYKCVYYT